MDTEEPAAALDVAAQGALLTGPAERVARGGEEDHRVVAREPRFVKRAAFSVRSTRKPWRRPSCSIVAIPVGMESWRNAVRLGEHEHAGTTRRAAALPAPIACDDDAQRERGPRALPDRAAHAFFENAASNATEDGAKSVRRTNASASGAPQSRSIPESSHSIDSGPS